MIWGEQFTAGVLEFRAVKGSTLTLKGEGNQWLQKPTVIPFELTVKVLLGGPLKSNDFVVDLGVNERLLIGGKLENFGETNINGGGIREVGGTFLNHGLLGIPFSDIGHLDVTSFGEVRQKGDVRYGRVSLLPGSRYDIYGAKLLPGGTGLRALDFQAGSKFTAGGSGTSRVEGLAGRLNHFGSDLEVFGGAALELKGLNSKSLPQPNREFVYRIHKMGSLLLDDYEFRLCKVVGKGKVSLTNAIVGGTGSVMVLEVIEVDLTGMNLQRDFLGEGLLELRLGKNIANLTTPGNQIARIDMSKLGENTKTTAWFGANLDVVGPLTLDGTLDIVGLCSLRSDISGKLTTTGKLIISNSSREHFPFLGRLTVPRDTQNVMIGVDLQFKSPDNFLNYGLIIVKRNSSLVFADGVADSFFVDGKLTQGFWRVQEGASCLLRDNIGQSEIDVIGKNVKVTIEGAGTPGRIADLPSPTHSLFVEGELELRGATLDMDGQTLWNRKKVTGSGATIIGEVQSIRGDVQGVIQLSGDIRIEGNLTTDGVISMGASPGTGQVTGDLTLLPGSEMIVEFEGTEAGTEFDFMEVGGTINLDGKLTLKTLDDYVPPIGQGYRIISATEVTGAFAEIEQSEVGRTRRFEVLADDLGVNAVAGELVISSFDDWRAASFTADELANPFLRGATADPDRDGIYNLYEYVTHGLPKKAGPEPFEYRNGKLLLRWANNVSDYRWQLETSVGLESWEPIGAFFSPQGVGPDETVFELVVGGATASSSERYYQLRVLPVEP